MRSRAGGSAGATAALRAVAVAIACSVAALPGHPRAADAAAAVMAQVDAAWPDRDAPGKLDDLQARLLRAEAMAPDDYEVLWRLARLYFWMSDDPSLTSDRKRELGKSAWSYGDRATAVNARGVEGWYFSAVGIGSYALGIGVLQALGEGIEGKFRDRLSRAEALDPSFLSGAIHIAWGRFYYELPWPKYDARRSEAELQQAIRMNPDDVRGRVFLAELYLREGHPSAARKLLTEAASHRAGAYDAAEERRSSARAKELLARIGAG